MSILDTILNVTENANKGNTAAIALANRAPAPTQTWNLDHSLRKGDTITESGARRVEQSVAITAGSYRGLGRNVEAANNDPQEVQAMAGLNWRVIPMPLAIQGKREYRPFPNKVALVRSDDGTPLAVASTDYKPHQNGKLVSTMCKFANEAGLKLSRVGLFDGGERGFAVATSGVNREAKVGDMVAMHIILRFGHAPGTATSFRAFAHELRCSNGACIEVAVGKTRFVHSAELTDAKIAEARNFVIAAANAFNGHIDKLAMLRQVKSNKGLDLLQLTQLFQPELAIEITDRIRKISNIAPEDHAVLGARVVEAILDRHENEQIVARMIQDKGERLLNKVVEATIHQAGGAMTAGTMAHAYSGVTYFNSNVRGRAAETGLESNLFGTSQQDSGRALELAVQTAATVQAVRM